MKKWYLYMSIKYIVLLICLLVLIFMDCTIKPIPTNSNNQTKILNKNNYEIIEIDGCEYIMFREQCGTHLGFGYLTHKGNCKNPIHQYNKEK